VQGLGRLQDSAFGDLIVPIIVLLLCLVSLGIGIGKVVNNASGVRPFAPLRIRSSVPIQPVASCLSQMCSCAVASYI
jgi:hypothetical protein